MMIKRLIQTTVLIFMLAAPAFAAGAPEKTGSAFDKPVAYPGKESVFIIVPSAAAKGGAGFMVYRQDGAGGAAVQVTSSPVAPVTDAQQILSIFGPTATDDLRGLGLDSADEFWDGYKKKPDVFEFAAWYSMPLQKVLGHIYEDRGVAAGAEYVYRVEIVDGAGKTVRKFDALAVKVVPPEIPGLENFKGEALDSSAKFTWKKPEGAKKAIGIDIYKSKSENGPFEKASDKIISTTGDPYYTDGGLENNNTYYYYAVMVDFVGNMSRQTEIVKISPRDLTPPNAPANVKVELKKGKAELSWDMSLEPDLAGYDVHRSTSAETGFAKLTQSSLPPDQTIYTDETAESGIPYYYRLTAVDKSANTSTASISMQLKMPDTVPPAQTVGLAAKPGGRHMIVLSWQKSKDPDLLGYYIYKGTEPDQLERAHAEVIQKEKTSFEDHGAASGVTYYYALTAVDTSMNESKMPAQPVKVIAPDSDPPQPPIGLLALPEDGKVTLSWAESMDRDVSGYRLYYASEENGKFTKTGADIPKDAIQVVDAPAENGKKRWYYLTALDTSGNESEPASKVSATPYDEDPPQAPADATGTLVLKSVSIKWSAAPDKDIAGYIVCRTEVSSNGICGKVSGDKPLPKTKMTFEDSNLTEDVQYWYKVIAVDTSGNEGTKSEPAGPFKIEKVSASAAAAEDSAPAVASPAKSAVPAAKGGKAPQKKNTTGGSK